MISVSIREVAGLLLKPNGMRANLITRERCGDRDAFIDYNLHLVLAAFQCRKNSGIAK